MALFLIILLITALNKFPVFRAAVQTLSRTKGFYICYRAHIKKKNNQEKCHFKDEEQMACVMDMLFTLMIKHLAEYHMLELMGRETIRKNMHEQLEIIRHGL